MGNLIVKSNAFVGASYGLGVVEQRLILLAILKARETDSVNEAIGKTLTIHASEYMNHFGVDRATAYQALEDAVNGLYESEYRFIEVLPNGVRKMHRERFVSGVAYSNGLGQVELRFTPETVPLVVGLSENFTKYEIEQVSKLSSQYALRLYEVLAQWRARGKLNIKLDELRFKFGLLDDEYPRMDNFKRKVLDMAVNEINKTTDLTVNYEQHKQGRKIIGFTFTIKQKSKKTKESEQQRDTNTVDMFGNLTDQERAVVASKNAYADSIQATPEHRQNLINQALKQHRQAEQDEKDRKEREKAKLQAQQAKEQTEKRAKDKQERQEKERAEQRKKSFIEMFENLDEQYQEQALDEVAKNFQNNIFSKWFKEAREQGTAHKDPRFLGKFYELFGL